VIVAAAAAGLLAGSTAASASSGQAKAPPPTCSYQVIQSYPHDPNAFTQGLVISDGELYESTGLYRSSSLRRVTLETGAIEQIYRLPGTYFGEGITDWGDTLIQLTYREYTGFIYDRETFAQLDDFSYTGEGWGLTQDGERLIMSDGTTYLRFWDPATMTEIGQVQVSDDQGPVDNLNELEYICGEVWANVWRTDLIARIEPDTGQVVAWVDLSGLLGSRSAPDVLNGIAYDARSNRVFVTGKRWPTLFEIELVGCPQRCLFADSFESGTTSAWSSATTAPSGE
jgi:glutamine cyclotransferase